MQESHSAFHRGTAPLFEILTSAQTQQLAQLQGDRVVARRAEELAEKVQRTVMDAAIRKDVRKRAGNRCEYCLRNQTDSPLIPLQIEHFDTAQAWRRRQPRKSGFGLLGVQFTQGEQSYWN